MRQKGKIASWNDDKGFGFITPLSGGNKVFIHISAFSNRNRRPEINEVVTYSISKDNQGRQRAANATLAGDKPRKWVTQKTSKTAVFISCLFLAAVGASVLADKTSVILLIGYVALSLVTYIAYAIDKSAAQRGAWRTSEGTLLLLGLAGGWPGALIAQETLRHKSKKTSFRAVFWVTVVLNCVALAWLHTEGGRTALKGILV